MKTTQFCQLIERAIVHIYGEDNASQFNTVPYLNDLQPAMPNTCLGIFINDVVHMASVSAQAMLYMAEKMRDIGPYSHLGLGRILQDMEDFALLMQLFRVAPYMQWTCIYFPGLQSYNETTDDLTEGLTEEIMT